MDRFDSSSKKDEKIAGALELIAIFELVLLFLSALDSNFPGTIR